MQIDLKQSQIPIIGVKLPAVWKWDKSINKFINTRRIICMQCAMYQILSTMVISEPIIERDNDGYAVIVCTCPHCNMKTIFEVKLPEKENEG